MKKIITKQVIDKFISCIVANIALYHYIMDPKGKVGSVINIGTAYIVLFAYLASVAVLYLLTLIKYPSLAKYRLKIPIIILLFFILYYYII